MKNDHGSISNNSKITPESFRTNFHIIFTLQDPKTINFQFFFIKKFKSKPKQPWVYRLAPERFKTQIRHPRRQRALKASCPTLKRILSVRRLIIRTDPKVYYPYGGPYYPYGGGGESKNSEKNQRTSMNFDANP